MPFVTTMSLLIHMQAMEYSGVAQRIIISMDGNHQPGRMQVLQLMSLRLSPVKKKLCFTTIQNRIKASIWGQKFIKILKGIM